MGSNKITGLANGTAAGDAANLGQVQSTVAKLLGSVSGADTITAVGSPTVAAYAAGQMFYFVAAGANTGAVTINIDSLGAKSITRDGTTALAAGDIQSGEVCVIVYDGTQFQLVNGASQSASIVTENLTVNKATVLNESGGDNDTRIEGDTDPNLVFVDASTDRVGFGTNTPGALVDVDGDALISGLTVGKGAGAVATNTAVGASAIAATATGVRNTGVGYQSLNSVTSGERNTAVGYNTLQAVTTGASNTAVGESALEVTTGSFNVGIGKDALAVNTSGANNTAVGTGALLFNTTASNNTAVGYQAMYSNTTSTLNTAIGVDALKSQTDGTNVNVAIGHKAMELGNNANNFNNVAVGGYALQDNIGTANVAIGRDALTNNTTGAANVAVGYATLDSNTTGNRNTALGDNALGAVTTADNNVGVGRSAGLALTTGVNNTFVGAYNGSTGGSGESITTGSKNTILGSYNGNQGGLDIRTSSNNIVLSDGDGNPRVRVTGTGTFVIPQTYNDTTANAANMEIDAGGVVRRSTSSLRYKTDVQSATHGLADVLKLRSVTYKGINDGDKVFGGLIAEEVHDAGLTEFVVYDKDGQPDALAYGNMVSVLVKAIQELKAEFDAYKETHP
jgi:hypothetical protein